MNRIPPISAPELLGGALFAGLLAGGAYAYSASQGRTATRLGALRVERIADIAKRAETNGGDAGVVAIRGTAAPLKDAVSVEGIGPCVAVTEERVIISNYVDEKTKNLEERRSSVGSSEQLPPFLVRDSAGDAAGYAEVTPRYASDLPMTPGPKSFERMSDSPSYTLQVSSRGLELRDERKRERIVGMETLRQCLPVGTVLTVVAHASTDMRGGLQLTADASGLLIISRNTLAQIVTDQAALANLLKWVGAGCLTLSTALTLIWLYKNRQLLLGDDSAKGAGAV